jgi:hypothetical protein
MQERVRKTDVSGWSEEELAAARDSLSMLRDTIDNFPYPAGSANLA